MATESQKLQRVAVRMLYDPAFVEAVYADPAQALGPQSLCPVRLPPEAHAWLTAQDRRAWGVDPLRRARTLTALIQECPAAGATALALVGSAGLDAWYSTPSFHGSIQRREAIVLAFCDWLIALAQDRKQPGLAALATLEQAIARVRRASGQAPEGEAGGPLVMSPWCSPVRLPEGGLAHYQATLTALGGQAGDPLEAAVQGRFKPPAARLSQTAQAFWIVEAQPTRGPDEAASPAIGGGSEALNGLLGAAERPCAVADLIAEAVRLGAEPDEAPDIVEGLVDEGLLWPAPASLGVHRLR